ncbi:MAG: cupin domain-containing protein [Blautia sp.]|nr:cupin domain-containing protein [Blautia sp.]MDY5032187.1 cupin domain-containing protein [Blautia sp.]
MHIRRVENMCGGAGHVIIKEILEQEQLGKSSRLYAEVTLEPGCEIGYHEHHNESETYYIMSGLGMYNDNGKIRQVKPGDITFTPDGKGHGLKNTCTSNMILMALILTDQK